MSDTLRTDEAEYESIDEPISKLGSVDADFARQLERELTVANEMFKKLNIHALDLADRIKRLISERDDLRVLNESLKVELKRQREQVRELPPGIGDVQQYQDRIKRLEEAGDLCLDYSFRGMHVMAERNWRKAKEAKP